ncbi:hypothetical protein MM809_39250, partial [Klebsiella pneumoniae]|nr:hypothetical protein [Klebsiella pneumoniae]
DINPPRFLPGRLTRARVPFRPLLVVAIPSQQQRVERVRHRLPSSPGTQPDEQKKMANQATTSKKFKVMTAGTTVDGRNVTRAQLHAMAAAYN